MRREEGENRSVFCDGCDNEIFFGFSARERELEAELERVKRDRHEWKRWWAADLRLIHDRERDVIYIARAETNCLRKERDAALKKLEHEQVQFHRAYTDMTEARAEADRLRGQMAIIKTKMRDYLVEAEDCDGLALVDNLDADPPEYIAIHGKKELMGEVIIDQLRRRMPDATDILIVKLPKETP